MADFKTFTRCKPERLAAKVKKMGGMSVAAEELKVPYSRLRDHMITVGAHVPAKRENCAKKLTPTKAQVKRATALYDRGNTISEIAKLQNWTFAQTYRVLRDFAHVAFRSTGRKPA